MFLFKVNNVSRLVLGACFLFQGNLGFAQSLKDQLKLQAQNASAAQVYDRLKTTGYASCRVYAGGANSFCNNYFVTTSNSKKYTVSGILYNGFPRYQNDTPPPSGTDNRYAPSPNRNSSQTGSVQASSGCFAGSGGAKSGAVCWAGNNDDECSLGAADYAKTMLIRMLDDPYDPCDVGALETALSSESSQSLDSLISNNKIFRSGALDCRIKIDATLYTPPLPRAICKSIKARATALNQTLPSMPTSTWTTVPLTSSPGYQTYLSGLTSQANTSISTSLKDVSATDSSSGSGLGALKLPSSSSSSGSGSLQP